MSYTLYTQSFGISKANSPVTITSNTTGRPATILSSASGGVVNNTGKAVLDASGNLAVYIDTSDSYTFAVNDITPATLVPVHAKIEPLVQTVITDAKGTTLFTPAALTDAQVAAGGTAGVIALKSDGTTLNPDGTVFVSGGGGGGSGTWGAITGNISNQTDLQTILATKVPNSAIGAVSGVAPLDGSSLVPALNSRVQSVAGRTGAVTLASTDISGLATSATTDTTNASNIVTGSLASARLNSDSTPTSSSTNPVQSGGVFTALSNKVNTSAVGVSGGVASLDGSGKVPTGQLPAAVIGALNYQGAWNASTNSPTLTSGAGTKGFFYTVTTAGGTALDGISQWNIGDHLAYNGTAWEKFDGVGSEVLTVAGRTGNVTLASADLSDKGAANGVATLGSDSKVPAAQMTGKLAVADLTDGSALATTVSGHTTSISALQTGKVTSVGTFSTVSALQSGFPAASNNGAQALVGSATPYMLYKSDGTTWLAVSLLSTAQVSAGGTAGVLAVKGDGTILNPNGSTYVGGGGGGSVAWGSVTGTLSFQTDLQTALDAKVPLTSVGAVSGVAPLDGSSLVPAVNSRVQSVAGRTGVVTIDSGDVSGLAASATTDTTNATNIASGTLNAARLPTPTTTTLGGVKAINAVSHQFVTSITTAGAPVLAQPAATDITGLATSATTDTTNASNITTGTLPSAQLPNPTATTLGGVRSIVPVSHQFITSISTTGLPALAQPAASDITGLATSATTDTTNAANITSGTLPAARLPVPSATTLGGVQSAAPVTHQFVTGISTSGVPSLAQPAAGDISGLAASATTDTTSATNITTGTLNSARLNSDASPTSSSTNPVQSGGVFTALAGKVNTTAVGVSGGVASLDGSGKVPVAQLPASVVGALNYQGGWNASTNSPALVSATGTKGFFYTVTTAGTTALDGISQWNIGDHATYNGAAWEKFDGVSSEVVTVAGRTGAVTLAYTDISGLAPSASSDTTNASNISSGTLPAGRLPNPTVSTLGGVQAVTPVLNQFVTGISTSGVPSLAQPTAGNISGLAASATTDTTNAANITSGILPAARLPNPSATTLGGVQSAAPVTNQFVTGISTSGVPSLAQPSAANITGLAASATTDTTNAANITSGTLPAARLPVPSATTLGGVQSAAPVTNQFVTGISTSGVPSLAQPSAGNISGLAASATTDTTNASNIGSGTLNSARLNSDATPTSSSTNPVQSGGVFTALATKVNTTSVGAASGVASLGSDTKVPTAQMTGKLATTDLTDGTTLNSNITALQTGKVKLAGTYATAAALQSGAPAASNAGALAYVGSAAPYTPYVSNGAAWVMSPTITTTQATSLGAVGTGVPAAVSSGGVNSIVWPDGTGTAFRPSRGAVGMWWNFTGQNNKSRLVDRCAGVTLTNNVGIGSLIILRDQATVTFNTSTNVVNDATHSLYAGATVTFSVSPSGSGTMATAVTAGKTYYVISPTATTYQIATSPFGTAIALAGASGNITRFSDPVPGKMGAMFTNGGYLQTSMTQQLSLQQSIMRIDTLAADGSDAIVVAFDLYHGPGCPTVDGTIFWWGRKNPVSSGNGWGISMPSAAANAKLQFGHTGIGGSNVDLYPFDAGFKMQGDSFTTSGGGCNARSVVALQISRMPSTYADVNNYGRGGGLFCIEMHKLGVTDQGYFGQKNNAIVFPYRLPPNGTTAPAGLCDTALTIGAQPQGVSSTVNFPLQSTHGLNQIIFQRRKRQSGLPAVIARQMLADIASNPLYPKMPACIAI